MGRRELARWSKSWEGWGSSSLVSLRWGGRSTGSTGWNLQMPNSQCERGSLLQRLASRLHSFQLWQTWDALAKSRGSSTCPNISRITFVFNKDSFFSFFFFSLPFLSFHLYFLFFRFHLSLFSFFLFFYFLFLSLFSILIFPFSIFFFLSQAK